MNRIFLDNLIYFFFKTLNFTDIPVATEPVTTQPTLHYQIHTLQVHKVDRVPGFLSNRPNWLLHRPFIRKRVLPPPVPRGRGSHFGRRNINSAWNSLCSINPLHQVQYCTSREKQHRKADKKRLLVFNGKTNCPRSLVKHFPAFSSRDPPR
jgi:hypothetical protein